MKCIVFYARRGISTMIIRLVATSLCRNIFICLSERTILHLFLCRIGSPNGKVMSLAGGSGVAIGRFGNAVFGIDNFLALPRVTQNGFMFGGIRYVMVWLIIRMIGRFKERRSFCGGDATPGRRVYPNSAADMFCRRRRAMNCPVECNAPPVLVVLCLTRCPTQSDGRRIPRCSSMLVDADRCCSIEVRIDATPWNGHRALKEEDSRLRNQSLVCVGSRSPKFPTPDAVDRVPANTRCLLELIEPRVLSPLPPNDAV